MVEEPRQVKGTATTPDPYTGRDTDDPQYRDPAYGDDARQQKPSLDPAYPPPYPQDTYSGDIHRDIARTRGDMDETVDELAERLKPRNLFDDLLSAIGLGGGDDEDGYYDEYGYRRSSSSSSGGYVKTIAKRGGKKLLYGVGRTARNHPFSATALVAGLAWMLFDSGSDDREEQEREYQRRFGHRADRWRNAPEHSGSYVDARTGQPYGPNYGSEYRGSEYRGQYRGAAGGEYGPSVSYGEGGTSSSSGRTYSQTARDYAGSAGDKASGAWQSTKGAAGSATDRTVDAAGNLYDAAGNAVGHAADALASGAGHTVDAAGNLLDKAGNLFARATHSTADYGRQGYRGAARYGRQGYAASKRGFGTALDEYPLAVGVAALAAGVLAGFLVPSTRIEDRYMGETSDDLKDAAGTIGSEAWQRSKQAAGATGDATYNEARAQGVDPDSLAGKARHVVDRVADEVRHVADDVKHDLSEGAQRVKRAAVEGAEDEGLTPEQLKQKGKAVADKATNTAKHEGEKHAEATKDKAKQEKDAKTS